MDAGQAPTNLLTCAACRPPPAGALLPTNDWTNVHKTQGRGPPHRQQAASAGCWLCYHPGGPTQPTPAAPAAGGPRSRQLDACGARGAVLPHALQAQAVRQVAATPASACWRGRAGEGRHAKQIERPQGTTIHNRESFPRALGDRAGLTWPGCLAAAPGTSSHLSKLSQAAAAQPPGAAGHTAAHRWRATRMSQDAPGGLGGMPTFRRRGDHSLRGGHNTPARLQDGGSSQQHAMGGSRCRQVASQDGRCSAGCDGRQLEQDHSPRRPLWVHLAPHY